MLNAKNISDRLLRLELLVSTLMADRDQLMEYVNAERQQSTDAHDESHRSGSQTEVEWGSKPQGGEGVRSRRSLKRFDQTP